MALGLSRSLTPKRGLVTTLVIPVNPVKVPMIGAMIIQASGPPRNDEQPSLFWGIIVSMWIGDLMLLEG